MTGQTEPNTKKSQMRAMWIGAAVIVLIFVLYAGLKLSHYDAYLMTPPNVTGKQ